MSRAVGEPCFILHQRPYRETSALVDVFSLDYGRFAAVAKGVRGSRRQRQSWRSSLQPFQLLSLSWTGSGEVKSLVEVQSQQSFPLAGRTLFCGFYLNELLQRLLHQFDPHPDIFHHYQYCLSQLCAGEEERTSLRRFEFSLLAALGFGFSGKQDILGNLIDGQAWYQFIPEQGFQRVHSQERGYFCGSDILSLASGKINGESELAARRWSRQLIHHLLGGRPLRSRELFAAVVLGENPDSASVGEEDR